MQIHGKTAAKSPVLSLAETLAKIREKSVWLRLADKQKLSQRYACSIPTVNRHLKGKTRKINVKLVADALDIAVANEKLINSRLV